MMKIDMHIHTKYSRDSILDLKTINKLCIKKGIIPVISDHNSVEGAFKYKRLFKECIIGEEINTRQGEIAALFLNKKIKPKLDIYETIDKIREQNAIVYVPHPFDVLRRERINEHVLNKIKPDIIEVFNSRNILSSSNKKAEEYALKNNYLKGAGSDAHTRLEVGNAFVIIKDFDLTKKKEFLKNLKNAKVYGRKSNLIVHGITFFEKIKNH